MHGGTWRNGYCKHQKATVPRSRIISPAFAIRSGRWNKCRSNHINLPLLSSKRSYTEAVHHAYFTHINRLGRVRSSDGFHCSVNAGSDLGELEALATRNKLCLKHKLYNCLSRAELPTNGIAVTYSDRSAQQPSFCWL